MTEIKETRTVNRSSGTVNNSRGETMKKEPTPKKKLLTGTNHPLLNIKEVIDTILKEAEGLPTEVRQILVHSRDATWKAFVETQERLNNSLR